MPWRFNPFTGNLDETDIPAFNGEVTLGSAASPSIFFTGDPNTGLYSPGADQVAISTNGTGRLFVDSSGRVLIGVDTSVHSYIQTVYGSTTGNRGAGTVYQNATTGAGAANGFLIGNSNSVDAYIWNYENANTIFATNGTERLRITSTGALNFVGAGTAGSTQAVSFNGSAPVNSLVIDSTGKVGLGTSNVTRNFVVQSSSQSDILIRSGNANYAQLLLGDTDAEYRGAISYDHQADKLYIVSAGSTAITVDSSQRVGVGTTSPTQQLTVETASGNCYIEAKRASQSTGQVALALRGGTSGADCILYQNTNSNDLRFYVNGSDRAAIDSSGRLLVGTSSTVSVAGSSAFIQHHGNKTTCNLALGGFANNLGGPILAFGGSRSTTIGTPGTIVANGDILGDIRFAGDDGTDINTTAASIRGEVDGTPGANDMPGRLIFSTTADGASSPTERMRIDSSGRVGVGTTNPTQKVQITDGSLSNFYIAPGYDGGAGTTIGVGGGEYLAFNGAPFTTERMRIDSSGRLLVGTSSTSQDSTIVAQGSSGSASAIVRLASSSATPADGEVLGRLFFTASNHSASASVLASRDGGTWTAGTSQPSRLTFSTTADGASSPTERMRITSTGQMRLAGAGITFNGDTAAANELDDYEEGTWTPVVADASSGGNTGTFATNNSWYRKIGNTVFVFTELYDVDTTGLTAGNTFWVRNLPFNLPSSKVFAGWGSVSPLASQTSLGLPFANSGSSTTGYRISYCTSSSSKSALVSDLTSGATDIFVCLAYYV